uniref:Uncharacterized protein n=1 Tax=viral metagenome TaxID=1070528 RepID=A0A6M3JHX1_9ZZZZ
MKDKQLTIPKLGFDIDGTAFDIMTPTLCLLGTRLRTDFSFFHIKQHDVPKSLDLTAEETLAFKESLNIFLQTPYILPYKGFVEFIWWAEQNSEQAPVFITSRPKKYLQPTADLLSLWLRGIPWTLQHTDNKLQDIQESEIKVFFEDRRKIILELEANNVSIWAPVRPWNEEILTKGTVTWFLDWEVVLQKFRTKYGG